MAVASGWIYSTLFNDATLDSILPGIKNRIYNTILDESQTVYPVIVFNLQSAPETFRTLNFITIWAQMLYQVKVISKEQSFSEIYALANRIDVLLDRAQGTTSEGQVFFSIREYPIEYAEYDEKAGILFQHAGAIYRLATK